MVMIMICWYMEWKLFKLMMIVGWRLSIKTGIPIESCSARVMSKVREYNSNIAVLLIQWHCRLNVIRYGTVSRYAWMIDTDCLSIRNTIMSTTFQVSGYHMHLWELSCVVIRLHWEHKKCNFYIKVILDVKNRKCEVHNCSLSRVPTTK